MASAGLGPSSARAQALANARVAPRFAKSVSRMVVVKSAAEGRQHLVVHRQMLLKPRLAQQQKCIHLLIPSKKISICISFSSVCASCQHPVVTFVQIPTLSSRSALRSSARSKAPLLMARAPRLESRLPQHLVQSQVCCIAEDKIYNILYPQRPVTGVP